MNQKEIFNFRLCLLFRGFSKKIRSEEVYAKQIQYLEINAP